MSKSQQDQFIDDDEEEVCPLCVEEFDLTDKGFRPCPCGYQICQFCYNNVKNNMNGLCPACRRQYNDKDIEYKVITPEESAAHKARQAQKQKKTAAALQKEKQKAEADNLSRKHLAGLRVVQKNLVYVTGLAPTSQEDQLLATLRTDAYFGQYGKIIKIVVSKAKDPVHEHSVGVYVTYERKEDAAMCISMVNGSKNGDRTLRAQYGTTKYCSAYLRGETCMNRSCMFLHEPGEANDSYSRADLSALNAGGTQHGHSRPPPQSQQPLAATASQPMARQGSDQANSPTSSRPALASTSSWAAPKQTKTESRAVSGSSEAPAPTLASQPEESTAAPAPAPEPTPQEQPAEPQPAPRVQPTRRARSPDPLLSLLKNFDVNGFKFVYSDAALSEDERKIVNAYPPLFDLNIGVKRRQRLKQEEEARLAQQETQTFQPPPGLGGDDSGAMSGSLQLGGEPEERQNQSQPQSAIQPPGADGLLDQRFQFGGLSSPAGLSERGLTPQQHQQLLLQTIKSPNAQGSYLNQPSSFQQQQQSNPPGHQRNASRYSFANDSSAGTAIKPVANAKLLNQQSTMMPQQATGSNHFNAAQQQQQPQHFFTSNVQGPPPGLKTTGTPPVSGGMTFGQGHGFATGGLQYGGLGSAGANRNNQNEELMRSLMRTQREAGADKPSDSDFPPLGPPSQPSSRQQSISLTNNNTRKSTPDVPPGFEHHAASLSQSGRATPTVPPGLEGLGSSSGRATPTAPPGLPAVPSGLSKPPTAVPSDVADDVANDAGPVGGSISRPGSRAQVRRQITPVLPLRPGTPKRELSGVGKEGEKEKEKEIEVETPTKKPGEGKKSGGVEEAKGRGKGKEAVRDIKAEVDAARAEAPAAPAASSHAQEEQKKEASPSKADKKPNKPAAKATATTTQASETRAAPATPSKAENAKGRKHPGKLDITAAVEKTPDQPASQAKPGASETATPTASAQTPSKAESPGAGSPAVKNAPRTLRVVQTPTPKAETPPVSAAAAAPPVEKPKDAVPASVRAPSRQPSVASIQNLPGTPSSEQVSISDNISMTSASQSRANSPPPSARTTTADAGVGGSKIVGSAPVRQKTKAQTKKERQERAKQIEEEKAEAAAGAKVEEEAPQQEAIVSRKKKAKKEKPAPAPKPAAQAKGKDKEKENTPSHSRAPSPSPTKPEKAAKASKPSTPTKTPPATAVPHPEPSPPATPTLTPAQLIAELKATAPEIQKSLDSLLRASPTNGGAAFKPSQGISAKDIANPNASWKGDLRFQLSKEDVDALLKGTADCKRFGNGGKDARVWERAMVSPGGATLRALTQELEQRFLELEKAISALPEELKFKPTKPQNETKFPGIDLEALKRELEAAGVGSLGGAGAGGNGSSGASGGAGVSGKGGSAMEQMLHDGSGTKRGAFLLDEVGKYINEFVMPPATPPSAGQATGQPQIPVAGQAHGHAPADGYGAQGGMSGGGGAAGGAGAGGGVSVEIAERQLAEARRVSEEREGALRKVVRKNRKILGMG